MSDTDDFDEFEGFAGPIEAGKTTQTPFAPPDPTKPVFSDAFKIVTDYFNDDDIKTIVLPKFVTNSIGGFKERSYLLINFDAHQNPAVYKNVLEATAKGISKLEIHFLDVSSPTLETMSVWKLHQPKVHSIDFGYLSDQRPQPAEIFVEIDFKILEIDGVTI